MAKRGHIHIVSLVLTPSLGGGEGEGRRGREGEGKGRERADLLHSSLCPTSHHHNICQHQGDFFHSGWLNRSFLVVKAPPMTFPRIL